MNTMSYIKIYKNTIFYPGMYVNVLKVAPKTWHVCTFSGSCLTHKTSTKRVKRKIQMNFQSMQYNGRSLVTYVTICLFEHLESF